MCDTLVSLLPVVIHADSYVPVPQLPAMRASVSDDNPLARTQIKGGLDDLEAFGVRLKNLQRLSQSYAAALKVAANCWTELSAELAAAVPAIQLRDQGEQVGQSLLGLSSQTDELLGTPARAFYDTEIKPLRESKKVYDKARHRYESALKTTLSLKRHAAPAALEQADRELKEKQVALDQQRFELYSRLEEVSLRRTMTERDACAFLAAHQVCVSHKCGRPPPQLLNSLVLRCQAVFHTVFGVLSSIDMDVATERADAVDDTIAHLRQERCVRSTSLGFHIRSVSI